MAIIGTFAKQDAVFRRTIQTLVFKVKATISPIEAELDRSCISGHVIE